MPKPRYRRGRKLTPFEAYEVDFAELIGLAMMALARETIASDPEFWDSIPAEFPEERSTTQGMWCSIKKLMLDKSKPG